MAPSPPPVQGEALLTYTREEVAQHKKIGDCWIILHGEVYDVTKWLARHPGGARIVMHYAGEDATVSGSCVWDKCTVILKKDCMRERALNRRGDALINRLDGWGCL